MAGEMMQNYSAVSLAQMILLPHLKKCMVAVDATAGNGWDTLFLATNTPQDAIIYSFDIQKSAISATKSLLLKENLINKVKLISDSHENLSMYVRDNIDVVMFNLGYLPGGDHNITTDPESTVVAVEESLKLLKVGGFLTIIAYPGHQVGETEFLRIATFLKLLPAKIFAVNSWLAVNASKKPPILYVIEKVRSEMRESATSR